MILDFDMKKLLCLVVFTVLIVGCQGDQMLIHNASGCSYTTDFDSFIPSVVKNPGKYIVIDKFQINRNLATDISSWHIFYHDLNVPVYYYILRVNKSVNINGSIDVYVPIEFYERFNVGDTIRL